MVVNGRTHAACTFKAAAGQEVDIDTPELNAMRRSLVEMLFVEGNHFCPFCEKSGNCELQALAYDWNADPHFPKFYPETEVDASHPDVLHRPQSLHLVRTLRAREPRHRRQERLRLRRPRRKGPLVVNSPGQLADSDMP